MIEFIVGFLIGGFIGVSLMALLNAAIFNNDDKRTK